MPTAPARSGKVTITGASELKKKLDKLGGLSNDDARRALRVGAAVIRNNAMARAPVRTGNLRRSITVEDGPGAAEVNIGTDVFYAPFQEFGTSHNPPRPYLRPAFDENQNEAMRIVGETLWDILEGKL